MKTKILIVAFALLLLVSCKKSLDDGEINRIVFAEGGELVKSDSRIYPLFFTDQAFIYCQRKIENPEAPERGGGTSELCVGVITADGTSSYIGDFKAFSFGIAAADENTGYFEVGESANGPFLESDNRFTSVIYAVDLSGGSFKEIYRSNKTLPEFYMAADSGQLIIRQTEHTGDTYSTYLEVYDTENQKTLATTERFDSVNGIGRYMLNVSACGNQIFGLMTERDAADDEHETPSIVVYDRNLQEQYRIDCSEIKDYLIFTYPYLFRIIDDLLIVCNRNQSETLIGKIEDKKITKVFRQKNLSPCFSADAASIPLFLDLNLHELYAYDEAEQKLVRLPIDQEPDSAILSAYSYKDAVLTESWDPERGAPYRYQIITGIMAGKTE